jgi:hypothetical protein
MQAKLFIRRYVTAVLFDGQRPNAEDWVRYEPVQRPPNRWIYIVILILKWTTLVVF